MSFLKPSLLNQDIQTQNNELFCQKTEVEKQTNETVSGNKTENTNCVTNIHNYGGNIPPEIKEYIDKRIGEKFEEIKANFIPKTAKPELSIIQYASTNCMCLRVFNSGCTDAENVSIKVPEDEITRLLNNGWDNINSIRKCFETDHFTLHSGEQCEFAKYVAEYNRACFKLELKQRPRLFLVTYSYQRGEGTVHPPQERLLVRIKTFTYS